MREKMEEEKGPTNQEGSPHTHTHTHTNNATCLRLEDTRVRREAKRTRNDITVVVTEGRT